MARFFRLIFTAVLLVIIFTGPSMGQGEAGASSLIIPPSARANALGQSFVALVDDATSLWWNPAGMAFIDKSAYDLMYTQLVPDLASDVSYQYYGGIYRLGGFAVIGAAIQYLAYGEWEATGEDARSLGIASSYEFVPTIGGAIKVTDDISFGMNLKFIYINLAPAWATVEGTPGTGHSVAVDFGGLWKVPDFRLGAFRFGGFWKIPAFGWDGLYNISRLNLGIAVSNIGPSVTFQNRDQAAHLPRNLRIGFAYTPVANEITTVTVVGDINKSLVDYFSEEDYDRSNTYHGGFEVIYVDLLVIRAGYVHDKDGDIRDTTYGLGFLFNKMLRIDYASVPQASDLARVHRWSIGVTF